MNLMQLDKTAIVYKNFNVTAILTKVDAKRYYYEVKSEKDTFSGFCENFDEAYTSYTDLLMTVLAGQKQLLVEEIDKLMEIRNA